MLRNGLAIGIIFLFTISSLTPMTFGYNARTPDKETIVERYNFDRYDYPEYYDSYDVDETLNLEQSHASIKQSSSNNIKSEKTIHPDQPTQPLDGPMDSPWPMHGHDTRHTGRSPHSTVDTWDETWRFVTKGWALSSPAIGSEGTIYIGSWKFYAVYPNGTLKWECDGDLESSCPAIDENGTIYIGTYGALRAINPDGTTKWTYGASDIKSSPAIGDDGTIYFGSGGGYPPTGNILALNPDGSLKWSYPTNHVIHSSPAIGIDGTIYCGSHDEYVYALYPNNGTLKWKFKTGSWVHGSPTIADDGTIYIGSDDGYLYALYPNNGTMKWKCNVGCIRASPALDEDGTLYVGVWEKVFYAIYPNGTIKWSFNTGGGKIWGSSAALSADDTLYFGTCDLEWSGGVEIIALYTDGTVKWRKGLDTVFSSPAIGSDGTVYIGSCGGPGGGYLNAFGIGELEADINGPYYGLINQAVQFTGTSSGGYSPHSYHWDFGDTYTSEEQNPLHTYTSPGNYTITLTVTDNSSNTSIDTSWAWIQESNDPPTEPEINGPTNGNTGTSYDYTFTATDPDESIIYYYVEWDDNTNNGWLGPYNSGEQITISHTWSSQGTYTIRAKVKDPYDDEGPWGTLEVTMPRNRAINIPFFNFLENHPILFQLLQRFFKL
ncbi:MAG: PQQ-binding-like beta-propeller repeat protein [Thermoplasmatales archaeon]|nr:PQQ-binding-like beta-propeller repeat protein [Thermoplasmatales archaeon]